jgi:ribosomal protein L20
MNSFLDLVAEEEKKYYLDRDKNKDTDSLFLLWIIKEVMNSYVNFDSMYTHPVTGILLNKGTLAEQYIYYDNCEPWGELKKAIDKTAFDVPLITAFDFFIYLFDYLEKVIRRLNPSMLAVPPTNGNLNFPVNYRYFQKIIVGMKPGEWNYIDENGRKITVLKGDKIQDLTEEELIKPTDGFYREHTYYFNSGSSYKGQKYFSKNEAIELHAKWIARAKVNIQRQKIVYSNNMEGMKAQGYPYIDTYEDYVRFLQTNLKDMKFLNFTLKPSDLFNLFIPYPLK